jgi:hypothetical protein
MTTRHNAQTVCIFAILLFLRNDLKCKVLLSYIPLRKVTLKKYAYAYVTIAQLLLRLFELFDGYNI